MRHFIHISDITSREFHKIIKRGLMHRKNRKLAVNALKGKNIVLLFEKASTRTRLSFQVAITDMGGTPITIESQVMQLGRGETVEDTITVLGRYVDGIMIRSNRHQTLEQMAGENIIPVINGLSDLYHPCQAMADYMTIMQYKRSFKNIKIAFIGEPNNVFNSLALGAAYAGASLRIATPKGYSVYPPVLLYLKANHVELQVTDDPKEAAKDADVLYTDVWVSMGQEKEMKKRKREFARYQISSSLCEVAAEDHVVMHCLPAHRGEEIVADVMERYKPMIMDQAENRLHVQKAILEWVYGLL